MKKQTKKWISSLIALLFLVAFYLFGGGDILQTLPEQTQGTESQIQTTEAEIETELEESGTEAPETEESRSPETPAPTQPPETTSAPTQPPETTPAPTQPPQTTPSPTQPPVTESSAEDGLLDEHGHYSSKDEVALYIHQYGHLPYNYLTKNEAKALGWVSKEGNLWKVAPGMSIGGDRFYNREDQLPDAPGRLFYECDIDYSGGHRNAKRIVFTNQGQIYYTDDHYETFVQLY